MHAPSNDNISPDKPAPFINLPAVTKGMIGLFWLVHLGAHFLLTPPALYDLYMNWGFVPARYSGALPFDIHAITGLIGYSFLHGGWAHIIMNSVMMAAFGTAVERRYGPRVMLGSFALASLIAAATQFALAPQATDPVIGASGGISGLFAIALLTLYRLSGPLNTRTWLPMVLLWIGVSILFGMMGTPGGGQIAWAAHIGGFISGIGLFFVLQNRTIRR